jgi:NADPH2:quinone reductase
VSGVVYIHSHGGPEVLQFSDRTLPPPKHGEVQLTHDHIGVNYVDLIFRAGIFPLRDFPAVLGMEGAGRVTEVVDKASRWNVGDRVAYWTDLGAYAEQRLIDGGQLVALPDDITTEAAAAVLSKGMLVWALINLIVEVKPGDIVVVGPAAGGVGTLLTRWLTVSGVRVIGIVGSEHKAAQVRKAGIEDVVVSAQPGSAADDITAIVGARSIDVLFDGVGGPGFSKLWPLVKPGGTAVLYGHAAGLPPVDPGDLAERNVRFVQPSTGQYVNTPDLVAAGSAAIFNALRDGIFGTVAPTVYPLAEARKAHADIGARRTTGSVLLTP